MLKKLKDLTIYEAWEVANKHCNAGNSDWETICGKCPFNRENSKDDNCSLCNHLFSEVGDLSEADLEKTVEVDDDCVMTIYTDDEIHMTVEDKNAKIRNQKTEIQNLLTVNQSLRDRILRLKAVVDGQQKIIEDLVD